MIFAAGSFGGLVKALVAWCFGAAGINALLGFKMAPALTSVWIYQHLVWGGIWALLFLLPLSGSYYFRGAIYSLGQTLVQLLVIFPKMNRGLLGLELGPMAPVLVCFFGVVWGLATGFWLKYARKG
ncbi:MAG: hypothetical protein ABIG94_08240 [Pseudomonadota bacterium]